MDLSRWKPGEATSRRINRSRHSDNWSHRHGAPRWTRQQGSHAFSPAWELRIKGLVVGSVVQLGGNRNAVPGGHRASKARVAPVLDDGVDHPSVAGLRHSASTHKLCTHQSRLRPADYAARAPSGALPRVSLNASLGRRAPALGHPVVRAPLRLAFQTRGSHALEVASRSASTRPCSQWSQLLNGRRCGRRHARRARRLGCKCLLGISAPNGDLGSCPGCGRFSGRIHRR